MKDDKQLVRQREGHKCFFCKGTYQLTFAHIWVWRKDGGKTTKENGMCICRECHDKLDFMKGISREEQIKMLRQCKTYLLFMYCLNDNLEMIQREIPIKKLKK